MDYKILASNLPNPEKVTLYRMLGQYMLLENRVFGKNTDYKLKENISAVELINQKNQSSFLGKVGWGILGNALFGGVGAIAGVLCGGNETALICAIEVYPSWKLVAQLDEEAYKDLRSLAKKNASLGKVLADSDLVKVKEDFIPKRKPAATFSPGAGIITPPPPSAADKTHAKNAPAAPEDDFIPAGKSPAPKAGPENGAAAVQSAKTDEICTKDTKIESESTKLTLDDLPKLKNLLDAGIITQEEFDATKKKVLGL